MSTIVIADNVCIPDGIDDLESFRHWARSDAFPESGRFSFLAGQLWVDLSMEQLFTHNLVKTKYTVVLGGLVEIERRGYYFSDGTLLSSVSADWSTEPDGTFVSWESLTSGRVRLIEGTEGGAVELEGAPDVVLEVVSRSSLRKDTVVLRDLYEKAGVKEYWLVDARKPPVKFEILRLGEEAFESVKPVDGWLYSAVFGRSFRLTATSDPLGHPSYLLESQV